MTWEEWRDINEEMITIIRAYNKDAIPLVAGLDWAYDLTRFAPVPSAPTTSATSRTRIPTSA